MGQGKTEGATSFTFVTIKDLKKWITEDLAIPVSRVWLVRMNLLKVEKADLSKQFIEPAKLDKAKSKIGIVIKDFSKPVDLGQLGIEVEEIEK